MADTKANNVPVFERGDIIRLELQLHDSSGISRVETRFRNESEESVRSFYRSVELEGETDALAVIQLHVGEDLPPGNYVCEYVAITDRKGNQSVIAAPGIEFRVEGDAEEDSQGPALLNWSIA